MEKCLHKGNEAKKWQPIHKEEKPNKEGIWVLEERLEEHQCAHRGNYNIDDAVVEEPARPICDFI